MSPDFGGGGDGLTDGSHNWGTTVVESSPPIQSHVKKTKIANGGIQKSLDVPQPQHMKLHF